MFASNFGTDATAFLPAAFRPTLARSNRLFDGNAGLGRAQSSVPTTAWSAVPPARQQMIITPHPFMTLLDHLCYLPLVRPSRIGRTTSMADLLSFERS
jgi:hypothetical protein